MRNELYYLVRCARGEIIVLFFSNKIIQSQNAARDLVFRVNITQITVSN